MNECMMMITGDASSILRHTDCTLFLCWPPDVGDMASECLEHYKGTYIVYIGEWLGRSFHNVSYDSIHGTRDPLLTYV
jgi:hypothetical protein